VAVDVGRHSRMKAAAAVDVCGRVSNFGATDVLLPEGTHKERDQMRPRNRIEWLMAKSTILTALSLGAACGGPAPALEEHETASAALSTTAVYFESTNTGNTVSDRVYLDIHDSDPKAIYFVSPTWTPGSPVIDGHPIGVMFDAGQSNNGHPDWAIFNEDHKPMPYGTGFSIYTRAKASNVIQLVAGQSGNYAVNDTAYIDNQYTNNNPNALVWVTQNLSTVPGRANPYNVAVKYDSTRGQWAIVNLHPPSDHGIILGAGFNVVIESGAQQSFFVKTATAQTSRLVIADPRIDGRPGAKIMVTQVAVPGVYNDHLVGACFSGGQWAVCNLDVAPIPAGASFNVWLLG